MKTAVEREDSPRKAHTLPSEGLASAGPPGAVNSPQHCPVHHPLQLPVHEAAQAAHVAAPGDYHATQPVCITLQVPDSC